MVHTSVPLLPLDPTPGSGRAKVSIDFVESCVTQWPPLPRRVTATCLHLAGLTFLGNVSGV